jgi:uncharacterized protein (UPF0147 family)
MMEDALRNRAAALDERVEAVRIAGEIGEINDHVAESLLAIVRDRTEPEELRATAAIALGPVLEECDIGGFEDEDEIFRPSITEATFHAIRKALQEVHADASEPKLLRRRALEAAVRAPAEWHADAIRAASAAGDHDWTLTAIFAMQYVPGFDREVLNAVEDRNPEIRFEALRAAGARCLEAAWPKIRKLLVPPSADRDLLLAAIEAAPSVSPEEAEPILLDLAESEDEEIANAADDALSFIKPEYDADEDEEEDEA